jgi:ATP/ADP translocase
MIAVLFGVCCGKKKKKGAPKSTDLEKFNAAVVGAFLVSAALVAFVMAANLDQTPAERALFLVAMKTPILFALTGWSFFCQIQLSRLAQNDELKKDKRKKIAWYKCPALFGFLHRIKKYILFPLTFIDNTIHKALVGGGDTSTDTTKTKKQKSRKKLVV